MLGALAVTGLAAAPWAVRAAAQAHEPNRSLAGIDEEFVAAAASLARRAEAAGLRELAEVIRGWHLPEAADRQHVVAIPAPAGSPDLAEKAAADIWADFLAARRLHAEGVFAWAQAAAAGPDGEGKPGATVRLAFRALRDDPDHAAARAACGWVRRGDGWVWPEAARRLDRGEAYDPRFGWLPAAWLARYRAGERHDRGRWTTAAEDDSRALDVAEGRRFTSDHWEILSSATLAETAEVALRLEETRLVWLQVFGGFGLDPAELVARLTGASRPAPREAFAAAVCADRRQYVSELEHHEPLIGLTSGLYWRPTQTLWLCAAPRAAAAGEADADRRATVYHEATHQLCAELPPTRPLAGERCGFWAIEAAACYMESIRPAACGWTVGGRDAGRVPAARILLVEDAFHVPLAELTSLGRAAFQADPRVAKIYAELAGLADFFMNGERGRHREAFVAYLSRVYTGTADADTLAQLCGVPYADLDAAYRRHLSP